MTCRRPPDLPLDPEEAEAYLAAGRCAGPITMNCSGKHAAMLAACRVAGWSTEDYLDPGHPLQLLVRRQVVERRRRTVAAVGTDGCGAPLLALSLTGLARAFASFLTATRGIAERPGRRRDARAPRVRRRHPPPRHLADARGAGRAAKMGAEAVQALALPDGRAFAFKIDDGAIRAVGPVLARALRRMGVGAEAEEVLARIGDEPLLGGGQRVGAVRAVF